MNDWQVQNMAKIIQKYNARLYHEALSILQDAQLAEDAVQEACFNALTFPDIIFAAECPKTCRYNGFSGLCTRRCGRRAGFVAVGWFCDCSR